MAERSAEQRDAPRQQDAPDEREASAGADGSSPDAQREASAGADGSSPRASGEDEAEAQAEAVEQDLDELVADLRRERDEYLELAQRARADFENYRRRASRESADAELRGKADLARRVLPALDNLERALVAAGVAVGPAEETGAHAEPASREVSAHEALAEGVALVHGELVRALAAAGIESFDPAGEPFDPALHEALSTRPAAGGEEPNRVAETLERGYRLGETLIRPARVVVTA